MPAHTYWRVGRYHDAVTANEHAIHTDESYLPDRGVQPTAWYPAAYYNHNVDFLLAAAQGDSAQGIAELEAAVELQDNLVYIEPPAFYYPVRETLGALLLAADRPADAEAVYRTDLVQYPQNGWSLFGLEQSLTAQGKNDEAAEVQKQFETAWQHADVTLTASRY